MTTTGHWQFLPLEGELEVQDAGVVSLRSGWGTRMAMLPDRGVGVAVFTNRAPSAVPEMLANYLQAYVSRASGHTAASRDFPIVFELPGRADCPLRGCSRTVKSRLAWSRRFRPRHGVDRRMRLPAWARCTYLMASRSIGTREDMDAPRKHNRCGPIGRGVLRRDRRRAGVRRLEVPQP